MDKALAFAPERRGILSLSKTVFFLHERGHTEEMRSVRALCTGREEEMFQRELFGLADLQISLDSQIDISGSCLGREIEIFRSEDVPVDTPSKQE